MARPDTAQSAADLAAIFAKARAAHGEGALARAEKHYKAVLERDSGHGGALHLLGLLNHQAGRHAQALRYMAEALKSSTRSPDLLSDYGLVLHTLGHTEEALAHFEAALTIDPDNPDIMSKRGVACLRLGRAEEALATFDRALQRDPAHVDTLGNRGNTLLALNSPNEAIESYDIALTVGGPNARLLTNRAHALKRLDRLEEALADLQHALALGPGFAEAAFELGMVQLALGDYANGWIAYERRWETGAFAEHRRGFKSPQWTGEQALSGRTILLHAEQGFGDTIQFVRYAALVAERGARVVLEVQPELKRLMTRFAGVDQLLARGEKLVAFDYHCPLMSLPRAFTTTVATVPTQVPYLDVADAEVAKWAERLPAGRPRVGVCWAGKASHRNDANRSIPLALFSRLFDEPGIDFVTLQFNPSDADRALLHGRGNVLDCSDLLHDFVDTAALTRHIDLVVTVDTSVAHLAGALGAPALVLLPFAADFRWLRRRDDSPWYPSLRLVRQPRWNDWDGALDTVRAHLRTLVAPRAQG